MKVKPPHTEVVRTDGPVNAIHRLRSLYKSPVTQEDSENPVTPPRVQEDEGETPRRINKYRPRKKQKFPLGTRVRVTKKIEGKRVVNIGTATKYDPHTGMYHVVFEDSQWDTFDEDEMAHFRLLKTKYKPRAPNTFANQLTVTGFYPKAGPSPTSQFQQLGEMYGHLYGLNAGSIFDEELYKWMAYRDLIKHPNLKIRQRWEQAGMNEFARLAQGHGESEGINVVTFIAHNDMPMRKKATYARYVVDYRPEKDEPWRLSITCGGDKLDYFGNTSTHSASMETIKCQLNSIISMNGAKAATGDISNMYLGSDLPEAEYARFKLDLIPEAFVTVYGLRNLATPDGFVYA